MSAELGNVAEQNTALLAFLAGTWTTRCTPHVHRDWGTATKVCIDTRYGGAKVRGLFQPLPDGSVAGRYVPIQNSAGDDESETDWIIRFELDRSDNALVAFLGNDKSVPGIKGFWSESGLLFRGNFCDGIAVWEEYQAINPEVTARPSTVSIIVYQASESSWLLDVAFAVRQTYPTQVPVGLRCRMEFWHFREMPNVSAPPHPQDIEESFDEILQRCDDVTQDVEFRIDEIDDMIASLEDSRTKCEEHLRLLGELKSDAESGKDEADFSGDDVRNAIMELHDSLLVPPEGFAGAGEIKKIPSGAWSELVSLQSDAESLETDLDFIEAEVDLPDDDLIGSAWTNAEFARGMQLLRENRNQLPPPDLSFLGALEPSVSKLSKAAARIVNTTVALVQMALHGEPLEELDYGPQIAGMAKTCERILSDVFEEKKEAIERDPIVGLLLADVSVWQYNSKLDRGVLTKVVKLVKKSIETNTAFKWKGMDNKRIAFLLFGGWIPISQATREHVLNPLRVKTSAEHVQFLPDRLSEFQIFRNGFVHHDLAETDDLLRTWECFQDCLKGLLQAFYTESE